MEVNYEITIKLNADHGEELPVLTDTSGEWDGDTFNYNVMYYGFNVSDEGISNKDFLSRNTQFAYRTFTLKGKSEIKDLRTPFVSLCDEIDKTDSSTQSFRNAMHMLLLMLSVQEDSMEMNTEYNFSRHCPNYTVKVSLIPVEEEKKPDGSVIGFAWDVAIPVTVADRTYKYTDTVYCIKPESAVHEALDRMFRKIPKLVKEAEIGIIEVSKKEKLEFPYKIV